MILYHGGSVAIEKPQVASPLRNRPLDFGSGFYTTTSLEQAKRWVALRRDQDLDFGPGVVSRYHFDQSAFFDRNLRVLKFSRDDLSPWFYFVMSNRHIKSYSHNYDLVIGPVANDKVFVTLTMFEQGIIDKFMAIQQLKTFVLWDQYLFHTEQALKYLKFSGIEG